MSTCEYYRTDNYHYCYLGWGGKNWNYCNPSTGPNELIYFSSKAGVMCTSHCGQFGYPYDWCFTGTEESEVRGLNERCSSRPGYSADGGKCIDQCQLYGDTYQCNVMPLESSGDPSAKMSPKPTLSKCSPPPINLNDFKDVKALMKQNSCPREFPSVMLRQLTIEATTPTSGVLALAAKLAQQFGEKQVQNYNDVNSVTGYVTIPAPPQKGLKDIDLPVVVKATITAKQLTVNAMTPGFVSAQMKDMNAYERDDRGRLIAASLGGPNLPFNFVPQTSALNRGSDSNNFWAKLEVNIREFARQGGRVDSTVILAYDDITQTRRPVGFGINVRFYDPSGAFVLEGDNCYFSNDPA